MIQPTIGRSVIYVLSQTDVNRIATRRGAEYERTGRAEYNAIAPGERYPAIITRVWGPMNTPLPSTLVNLTVFLDGTDTYWATSKEQIDADAPDGYMGRWYYPKHLPANADAVHITGTHTVTLGEELAERLSAGSVPSTGEQSVSSDSAMPGPGEEGHQLGLTV